MGDSQKRADQDSTSICAIFIYRGNGRDEIFAGKSRNVAAFNLIVFGK
jgi:hypothetical protein